MAGIYKVSYPKDQRGPVNCHAYAVEIDRAIYAGASVAGGLLRIARTGAFHLDLIVLLLAAGARRCSLGDVFPDVPLLANFEFYYHAQGVDVGFDPELSPDLVTLMRLRARNGVVLMAFHAADWGHSATQWQRDLHPPEMHSRISVLQ